MKPDTPTEREIADLIASAYDGWVAPDARRLTEIEQRLLDQPRLRGRAKFAWWWLFAALVTGAASALWWTVNYDSDEGLVQPVPDNISPSAAPPAVEPPARQNRPEGAITEPAGKPAQKQGPVIYQRER